MKLSLALLKKFNQNRFLYLTGKNVAFFQKMYHLFLHEIVEIKFDFTQCLE